MKKYLIVKVLIISFVFFLSPAIQGASDWEESIESYKQATRINPDYADAHCCLGLIYVSLNDKDSALEQYKILKRLDSERANQLFNMI
jgi:tetratricopeptide (TPR) repeat protein